jgi:hypothetical protein
MRAASMPSLDRHRAIFEFLDLAFGIGDRRQCGVGRRFPDLSVLFGR